MVLSYPAAEKRGGGHAIAHSAALNFPIRRTPPLIATANKDPGFSRPQRLLGLEMYPTSIILNQKSLTDFLIYYELRKLCLSVVVVTAEALVLCHCFNSGQS